MTATRVVGPAATAPGTAPRKARILVVDDDRLVLATVTHGLTEAGYEVIDADNGDDAILLAREHRPALALLDIRMEGKSGFDVAQTLRDAYRIPFMFLSAFADQATRDQVRALGALDYLVKPLEVGQIVPAVEAVLARLRSAVAAPAPPGPATPAGADLLADPLPLAVGVLMHRHALARAQALRRLHELAQAQGLTPQAQAERLLAAVEELARTGA
ncbi:MAG: response regulator [Burkholderiales bacterium]|nr:response regulator [Burkholderiales bacterium]MDE2277107.1 response regulator [Burkholderiales bacterium]